MRVVYKLPNGSGAFSQNELETPTPESVVKCGLKEYVIGTVATFGTISRDYERYTAEDVSEVVCYLKEKV